MSQMDAEQEMVRDEITGEQVRADEVVEFRGYTVGQEGKQILLDRLKTGEMIGDGQLTEPGWVTTRRGLTTIYVSVITAIVAILVGVIFIASVAMIAGDNPFDDGGYLVVVPMMIMGIVFLGTGVASIVGQFMCSAVPSESGGKSLALGAAICALIGMLISWVPVIGLIGSLVSLAGMVLFLLFLRRVANYLEETDLAQSAGRLLIFWVGMVVVFVLAGILSASAVSGVGIALIGLAMIVFGITAFVWWLRLIRGVRNAIGARIG